MNGSFLRTAAVVVFIAGASSAFAHHGIANFDLNKDVAFSGAVETAKLLKLTDDEDFREAVAALN